MNWETFYLVCFLVGLMLSALSLLGGMGHIGAHIHVPHHVIHMPATGHLPPAAKAVSTTGTIPWWNTFSLMIFLCWFGAAGYLLTRHGSFVTSIVLVFSALCGVVGGAIVFLFMAKVLLPHERELTADETDIVGAVGRLSAAIHNGGTGEMIYEQLGATRSTPARSEDGDSIQKQEEVFVIRYEKGIAYVRRWEDVAGDGE
jgi:hypothetical protein